MWHLLNTIDLHAIFYLRSSHLCGGPDDGVKPNLGLSLDQV
jgi:hypothetical protein